jgi:hypothetical protein
MAVGKRKSSVHERFMVDIPVDQEQLVMMMLAMPAVANIYVVTFYEHAKYTSLRTFGGVVLTILNFIHSMFIVRNQCVPLHSCIRH